MYTNTVSKFTIGNAKLTIKVDVRPVSRTKKRDVHNLLVTGGLALDLMAFFPFRRKLANNLRCFVPVFLVRANGDLSSQPSVELLLIVGPAFKKQMTLEVEEFILDGKLKHPKLVLNSAHEYHDFIRKCGVLDSDDGSLDSNSFVSFAVYGIVDGAV